MHGSLCALLTLTPYSVLKVQHPTLGVDLGRAALICEILKESVHFRCSVFWCFNKALLNTLRAVVADVRSSLLCPVSVNNLYQEWCFS